MNEESGSISLTRRRVLGGLLTVGGAGAAAGAGTMAYFSDIEESTSNSITAGTLNLEFDSTGTFQFNTSLAPSDTTEDSVRLVKDGSLEGSVHIDVSYNENHTTPNNPDVSAEDVARNLYVHTLNYGDTNLLDTQVQQSDPTLHDVSTLAQSESGTEYDLVDLADPTSAGTEFTVGLELANVGDEYQGAGINVNFAFQLTQASG